MPPAISWRRHKNSIKDISDRDFLQFVLQLSWFKTYRHAGAKQRKAKK
jgi:hypothetical protein